MVVAYDIGDPVRSFVLVPGTGKDSGAQPLCLDLARVSSIVGTVVVPSNMSSSLPVSNLTPTDLNTGKGKNDRKTENKEENFPSTSSTQSGPVSLTRQTFFGDTKRSLPKDEDEAPAAKRLKKEADPQVVDLRRRCEELQKQNLNLNRRLAMFHNVFRSKERLANFVKFLDSPQQPQPQQQQQQSGTQLSGEASRAPPPAGT